MRTGKRGMGLLCTLLLCAASAWANESPIPMGAEAMAQAQLAWEKRADMKETQRAIDLFSSAAANTTQAYEASWKLARGYWWLGNHSPSQARLAIFEKGKKAAEDAIRLNPNAIDGHYWLGVCLGRYGEERGVLKSLFLVDPIAKEMETVLAMDPKNGDAQFVLSIVYRKAPGWPLSRGDMKKSLELARLAVANRPDWVLPHVALARTLLAFKNTEEAKKELQIALSMPGPADQQPETVDDKQEAQSVLDSIH
jgi:tetratricopeptide (TPR) repeat protein